MMKNTTMTNRSYSELVKIERFEDRISYLSCYGRVGEETFGPHRYLNQMLYSLSDWERVRRKVILRDDGHDLAHPDYLISGSIYVHHINPITKEDILQRRSCVFDLENLVSVSFKIHQMIHYGTNRVVSSISYTERKPNDTCPWR